MRILAHRGLYRFIVIVDERRQRGRIVSLDGGMSPLMRADTFLRFGGWNPLPADVDPELVERVLRLAKRKQKPPRQAAEPVPVPPRTPSEAEAARIADIKARLVEEKGQEWVERRQGLIDAQIDYAILMGFL